jgi:hypothetical protein
MEQQGVGDALFSVTDLALLLSALHIVKIFGRALYEPLHERLYGIWSTLAALCALDLLGIDYLLYRSLDVGRAGYLVGYSQLPQLASELVAGLL